MPVSPQVLNRVRAEIRYNPLHLWNGTYLISAYSPHSDPRFAIADMIHRRNTSTVLYLLSLDTGYRGPVGLCIGIGQSPTAGRITWQWPDSSMSRPPSPREMAGFRRMRVQNWDSFYLLYRHVNNNDFFDIMASRSLSFAAPPVPPPTPSATV